MVIIRTIVATFIAISVVLLPAGMVSLPAASDQAMMVDQADMPCCPLCDTQNDHASMICASTCMSVAAFIVPVTVIALPPHIGGRPAQPFASEPLQEYLKAPPTRPPQL
jgi:hypothetical protein